MHHIRQALTAQPQCDSQPPMRMLLPLLACLILIVTSLTSVAHAADGAEGAISAVEMTAWHAPGDADNVPADADRDYPHHHSLCHGHDLAAPMKLGAAPELYCGARALRPSLAAMLPTRAADTPLRPPIA